MVWSLYVLYTIYLELCPGNRAFSPTADRLQHDEAQRRWSARLAVAPHGLPRVDEELELNVVGVTHDEHDGAGMELAAVGRLLLPPLRPRLSACHATDRIKNLNNFDCEFD
jgi:hypothetical protein